jgi:hypothetical protein
MAGSAEETLSPVCPGCGGQIGRGMARCKACGAVRPEFAAHWAVVSERRGCCTLSGAITDVRLPNGDFLWAPYFLDCLAAGWIDGGYAYTDLCPWPLRRSPKGGGGRTDPGPAPDPARR